VKSGKKLEKLFCSTIWKLFSLCKTLEKFILGLEDREGGREKRNNIHLCNAFNTFFLYFPFLSLSIKNESFFFKIIKY